jgi:hypothetical protein
MNKRIKQLAEQAGIVIPKDSEYNGHIYRNTIEKFRPVDCAGLCLVVPSYIHRRAVSAQD